MVGVSEDRGCISGYQPLLKKLLRDLQPSSLLQRSILRNMEPSPTGKSDFLLATGKASRGMAETLSAQLSIPHRQVLVVIPRGYPPPDHLPYVAGNHPEPGKDSVDAARASLSFVNAISPEGRLLFALSGGTSSLLCMPVQGVTFEDKKALVGKLMSAGAPIDVLNCVRAHLSMVKGGNLLKNFRGYQVRTIVLSDVPCHPPEIVGSGPTVFRRLEGKRTLNMIEQWLPPQEIPPSIRVHLLSLAPGDPPPFSLGIPEVVGDSRVVLETAASILGRPETRIHFLTHCLFGEARDKGKEIASLVRSLAPPGSGNHLFLATGECSVRLGKTRGRGGRTLELGLSCGLALKDRSAVVGALATDGVDGNSGLSGVLLESRFFRSPEKEKQLLEALDGHDSGTFSEKEGIGLNFGATGTNLNDLLFIYLSNEQETSQS